MFDKLTNQNKIKRSSFFASTGLAATGFFVAISLPFKLFGKNGISNNEKVTVQINPDAVSRKKIGETNA